jgi:hypothetical protein
MTSEEERVQTAPQHILSIITQRAAAWPRARPSKPPGGARAPPPALPLTDPSRGRPYWAPRRRGPRGTEPTRACVTPLLGRWQTSGSARADGGRRTAGRRTRHRAYTHPLRRRPAGGHGARRTPAQSIPGATWNRLVPLITPLQGRGCVGNPKLGPGRRCARPGRPQRARAQARVVERSCRCGGRAAAAPAARGAGRAAPCTGLAARRPPPAARPHPPAHPAPPARRQARACLRRAPGAPRRSAAAAWGTTPSRRAARCAAAGRRSWRRSSSRSERTAPTTGSECRRRGFD